MYYSKKDALNIEIIDPLMAAGGGWPEVEYDLEAMAEGMLVRDCGDYPVSWRVSDSGDPSDYYVGSVVEWDDYLQPSRQIDGWETVRPILDVIIQEERYPLPMLYQQMRGDFPLEAARIGADAGEADQKNVEAKIVALLDAAYVDYVRAMAEKEREEAVKASRRDALVWHDNPQGAIDEGIIRPLCEISDDPEEDFQILRLAQDLIVCDTWEGREVWAVNATPRGLREKAEKMRKKSLREQWATISPDEYRGWEVADEAIRTVLEESPCDDVRLCYPDTVCMAALGHESADDRGGR